MSTDLQGEGMEQHRRACGAGAKGYGDAESSQQNLFPTRTQRKLFLPLAMAEVSATKTYQEKP